MAFNEEWNEAIPADSEVIGLGASRIRSLKEAIRERLAIDHNFKEDETGDSDIGKHNQVEFISKTAHPSNPTAGTMIYDKSGKLYALKETGDPVELIDDTDQTIYGVKTFNKFPKTPESDPSSDYEVANKSFVESKAEEVAEEVAGTVVEDIIDNILIVVDQKSSGTGGGTFTSGSWVTRDINTVVYNGIDGASLNSNRITLPAGVYYVKASAPAFRVNEHKAILYNVSDSITELIGSSEDSDKGSYPLYNGDGQTRSFIEGVITIAGSKVFEIRHRCSSSSSPGLGCPCSFGVAEIYTQVFIRKIG